MTDAKIRLDIQNVEQNAAKFIEAFDSMRDAAYGVRETLDGLRIAGDGAFTKLAQLQTLTKDLGTALEALNHIKNPAALNQYQQIVEASQGTIKAIKEVENLLTRNDELAKSIDNKILDAHYNLVQKQPVTAGQVIFKGETPEQDIKGVGIGIAENVQILNKALTSLPTQIQAALDAQEDIIPVLQAQQAKIREILTLKKQELEATRKQWEAQEALNKALDGEINADKTLRSLPETGAGGLPLAQINDGLVLLDKASALRSKIATDEAASADKISKQYQKNLADETKARDEARKAANAARETSGVSLESNARKIELLALKENIIERAELERKAALANAKVQQQISEGIAGATRQQTLNIVEQIEVQKKAELDALRENIIKRAEAGETNRKMYEKEIESEIAAGIRNVKSQEANNEANRKSFEKETDAKIAIAAKSVAAEEAANAARQRAYAQETNSGIAVAAKQVKLAEAANAARQKAYEGEINQAVAVAAKQVKLAEAANAARQKAYEDEINQAVVVGVKQVKIAETSAKEQLKSAKKLYEERLKYQREALAEGAKLAAQEDAEQAKRVANVRRGTAFTAINSSLAGARPVLGTTDLSKQFGPKIDDLDQQYQKFKAFVNKSGIEGNRLIAILRAVEADRAIVFNDVKEAKAFTALKKLVTGYNEVAEAIKKVITADERRNELETVRQTITGQLQTPVGSPKGALAGRNAALINFQQVAEKSGLGAAHVLSIYETVNRGITKNWNAAEASVAKASANIIKAQDILEGKTRTFVGNLQEIWQRLDKIIVTRVLYTVISQTTQAFQQGVQAAIQYSNQIALIQTLTQDITTTHQEWSDVLRTISDQFGGQLNDVAEAVYEGVSNQIVKTVAQAEYFAEQIGKVSLVARSSFDDAGKLVAGLINSYGVGIESTNQINAKLFRAMDLGKFKFAEIAEQMGRAAPTANELGVSMDELLAALSTLTVEGRRADVSLTLIRNIMTKLLKPTEGLQKTLEGFGYSTGRAAVQTEGLIGILSRLQQTSPDALAEIFQDMRAIEGAVSLTGNSFKRFNQYFRDIKDTSEGLFENAVNIVRSNPLKQLEMEGNKIKNFFAVDVATVILEAMAKVNTAIGGLSNVIEKVKKSFENSFAAGLGKGLVDVVATIGDGLLNIVSAGDKAKNAVDNLIFTLKTVGETFLIIRYSGTLFGTSLVQSIKDVSAEFVKYRLSVKLGVESLDSFSGAAKASFAGVSNALKGLAASAGITALILGAVAAVEALAGSYEHLGEAQEKVFKDGETQRQKAIEGYKAEGKAIQKAYDEAFKSVGEIVAEHYGKLKKAADKNLENVLDGEKAFQEGIKVTFDARIKRYEEFVKKIKNEVEATQGLIGKINEDITKVQAAGFERVFSNQLELAKIQDNFSRDSIKAEKDRLKELVKDLDKAIEESGKRVSDLAKKEGEHKFDFVQKLKDTAQQYAGLVQRATEQRKKAEEAIAAGKSEEAAQLLADAAATKNEAEQNLQQRIEEAKKKGEEAAKDAIKKAEELSKLKKTPDNKRERDQLVKDQAKARVDSKAAFDEAKNLQDVLNAQERERITLIEAQTKAELDLQAAKKKEKEETEKQLADLRSKELAFQAQADKLIQDRVNKLFNLQTEAEKSGDFGRAVDLLKDQDKLLESLQQTKQQRFEQAVQAKDLDAQKRALEGINNVLGQRDNIQNDLLVNFDQQKQSAADQVKLLQKAAELEARNLLEIRLIARDASKINVLDKQGNLLDRETIAARLNEFDTRVKKLVGNGKEFGPKLGASLEEARAGILTDIDEFGQAFDFSKRIQAGLDVLQAATDKLAQTRIVPFQVELKGLDIVAATLGQAESQIREKLDNINKTKSDIGVRFSENAANATVSNLRLRTDLDRLSETINQELLGKIQLGNIFAPAPVLHDLLTDPILQAKRDIEAAQAEILAKIKAGSKEFIDSDGKLLKSGIDNKLKSSFKILEDSLAAIAKASPVLAPDPKKLEDALARVKDELLKNAEAEANLAKVQKDRASLDSDLIKIRELRDAIQQQTINQNALEQAGLEIQGNKITQLQAELSIRERIQQALTSGNPTPEQTQTQTVSIGEFKIEIKADNPRQLLQQLEVAKRNQPELFRLIVESAIKK